MLLLHIETTTTVCSAALSRDGALLGLEETRGAYVHAENLTVFCDRLLKKNDLKFSQLDGVSVSKGPGSYTGLRIGVSAAKGFCYALGIPLIAVDTLQAMAFGMRDEAKEGLLCPMIDARRMEVYCAVYDQHLHTVQETKPLVIDANSFDTFLEKGLVWFSGDGAEKCKPVLQHTNARFTEAGWPSAKHLVALAEEKFRNKQFEDLALFEPFYLKTFHPGPKRSAE
jgi:tRNA threonylcarbamoyladenosine biosynthesis protein TsaB